MRRTLARIAAVIGAVALTALTLFAALVGMVSH